MILTNREQQIIKLILSQPQGVSRDELTKQINISRRTVYRELAQLEQDIQAFKLALIKDSHGAYTIAGDAIQLDALRQNLTPDVPTITFNASQRQNALLVRLLLTSVPMTMSDLADELEVSLSTIKQDLDLITPALTMSQLTLNRQKATGVWISGQEADIRRVLVGIFASALNPYLFFQALKTTHNTFDPVTGYFFNQLPSTALKAADTVFHRTSSLASVSDNQRKLLLLTVTVHAMRVLAGYHVASSRNFDRELLFQDQQLALQFFAEMAPEIREQVRVGDYQFLAIQLNEIRGGLVAEQVDPFDLTVNLQVQSLIQAVEKRYDYPFSGDQQLYAALLAHVQRSVAGTLTPMLANPVLDHLASDYPKLYTAVQAATDEVFGQHAFVGNELAYVVLYFASVITGADEIAARVLLVTSDGPGTGRLIETKLRQGFPEIRSVTNVRISDLSSIDFSRYALILSTVQLPGFDHQYLVVTPLLPQSERNEISRLLSQVKQGAAIVPQRSLDKSVTAFEDLKTMVETASTLLDQFNSYVVAQPTSDINQALIAILTMLPKVVRNLESVLSALIKRLELAPVGIPDTQMALVHAANAGVSQPFIGVFDLSTPITLPAMDMQTITLKRVILLLTPGDTPQSTMQLLSAVSGMMVRNPQHLHSFETGNYSQLYQLITEAFLTEIQKIDRR
ncbi:BglG family transcription antiterminator [Lacticaseibacillus saniviri]